MSRPVCAFIYMRLSVEESNKGESSSISNQREILHDFCRSRNITILKEFVDDGYSGGNFQRPGFLSMLEQLDKSGVRLVITKDYCEIMGLNQKDLENKAFWLSPFFF